MAFSSDSDWPEWALDGLEEHEADRRTNGLTRGDPGGTVPDAPGESPLATGERRPTPPRYRLGPLLGEGATARVYRAVDLELGRPVALKILRERSGMSDVARQRFRREAQAAARISHPNVMAVYDVGEFEGTPFLVLELVEGRPLSAVLEEPGKTEEKIRLLERSARGVAEAHARGIVHRDLKPANILVGPGGVPKVGDFGLAHLADSAMDLTRTGAVLGTPLYMAPEQVQGKAEDIGPATDVHALSTILYEILAGRPPYGGETLADVYRKITSDDPEAPRALRPGIPEELEVIALKGLSKNPKARYPTAREFADDLTRYLAGEAILARPEGLPSRLSRRVRRHLLAVIAAGSIVTAAVLALTLLTKHDANRAGSGGPVASPYRAAWEASMTRISGRDYAGALAELRDAAARSPDESSRDEAATDLQDLAKLQALYASMLDRLAKLPRYRIISLEWRSPGGGRRRAAGGVVQANRERVELHAGPQTVFVEWPDATASSLLATMPSDVADARTAALFCLVDGDVEAARIYAGGRTEILPSKYWARAARRTATLPAAPAGELESRELLYQAERDFRSKETRPGAVEGYRRLLKEYQDSRVVVSLVERIRRRSEPGPAEPFEDWVDPALVAYWPFDEPAGEQAADASGRGHRVTAPGARRTDGRVGGALLLDAAAGFGSTPDAQDLRLSECFSASFWVRLDVHEAAHVRLLGKGDLQDTTFGIYALASSERKVMLQQQSEGFWFHLESTKLLSKGEWAHVAAVADGKHVVLYVNGEKDAEGDRRIVPPPGPPDALTIGRGPGFGAGLTGALDDVRLFSRVLGEQEVRALYDAGR